MAGVAQLVEHLICNQRVGGSNPFASSSLSCKEGPNLREAGGRNAKGRRHGAQLSLADEFNFIEADRSGKGTRVSQGVRTYQPLPRLDGLG